MGWLTNHEAERQLLGAILVFPDTLPVAMPMRREWFGDPVHQIVFEEILRADRENQPLYYRSLAAGMPPRRLEAIGGIERLISLADSVAYDEDVASNADRIRQAHMVQECLKLQEEEAKALQLQDDPVGEILARYSKLRMDLLAAYQRPTVISVGEAASRHLESLREQRNDDQVDFLTTPWPELDMTMAGLRPGRLIVVAAATSSGKTTLALNIGFHVAARLGVRVRFQSLEMDANPDLIAKIQAMTTKVDGDRIDWPKRLTDHEFRMIEDATDRLQGVPLDIDDSAYQTPTRVMMAIRLAVASGAGLAIVDLLQNLHYTAEEQRRSPLTERIGQAMRDLKQLARDLQIPIVVVSQINRKADEQDRPRLSNLADSAWIERSADQVLLLHRPNENDPVVREAPPDIRGRLLLADLAKNRGGPRGEFTFLFDAQHSLFEIYDPSRFLNETDQAVICGDTVAFSGFPDSSEGTEGGVYAR